MPAPAAIPFIPAITAGGAALLKKLAIGSLFTGGTTLGIGFGTGAIQDSLTQGAEDKLLKAIGAGTEDRLLTGEGDAQRMKVNPLVGLFVDEGQIDDTVFRRLNKTAQRTNPEYREALGLLDMKVDQVGNITPGDFLAGRQKEIDTARTAKTLVSELSQMVDVNGNPIVIPEDIKKDPNALRALKATTNDAISRSPYGTKGTIDYARNRQGALDRNNTALQEYQIAQGRDASALARYQVDLQRHTADQQNAYNNRVLDWKSGESAADRKQNLDLYRLNYENQRAERESRESASERKERLAMILALIGQGTQGLERIRF